MVGPGFLGRWLDRIWHMRIWTPLGFVLGMILGTVLLIVFAKQFTPVAKGRPLGEDPTKEEEEAGESDQDTEVSDSW
jgi:hypothetical protein